MSDVCCVEISCRRRDARRFAKFGFKVVDDDEGSGVVRMRDEAANYAHYGKLPKNIPYFGWHTSGGEYGPHEFACDGRKTAEVETAVDGTIIVHVGDDNTVDRRELRWVKEYRACLKRARRVLGLKDK